MFRWRVCTVKLEIQSEREIYWWNWSSRSSAGSEKIISSCGWAIKDTSRVDGTFLHLLFFPLCFYSLFYIMTIMYPSPWDLAGLQWRQCKHLNSLVPWPFHFTWNKPQFDSSSSEWVWTLFQMQSMKAVDTPSLSLSLLCVDLALFRGSAVNVLHCCNSFLIIR